MAGTPPIVLSIAGFDPSSGAGVTADVKTIAAHGCYGLTCITALTVQSTMGVKRVESLRAGIVAATLEELAADSEITAVRIGMLGSGEVAEAVAAFLSKSGQRNVVLDPILRSTSGTDLVDAAGKAVIRDRLLRLADVVTPNVDEAAELAGIPVAGLGDMSAAAARLHELGARAVVITGGHLGETTDLLSRRTVDRDPEQTLFPGKRVESRDTHGTGCAFATALACNLALGLALPAAVQQAKDYVAEAIVRAYPTGREAGPLNHLWNLSRKS